MIEYLLSLSLLIAVVLLIRAVFRKTISPRVTYALWLLVVIRMMVPVTLFEVDVTLPEFLQTQQMEQSEEDEHLTKDSQTSADMQEQSPTTLPVQTTPIYPPQNTTPVTPAYPPSEPDLPTVREQITPVTPIVPETEAESPILSEDIIFEVPDEPAVIHWQRIANLVWFIGAAVMALWVLCTAVTYNRRLVKNRILHRTVRGTKVYISEEASVPCISGLIPSIYITPEAANSKSEMLIIIHEHVHLRHGDHIWAFIRALALIVFWYNPLVWAAATVSKLDAELACDDAISAKLNDDERLAYAHILLDTIPQKRRYATGLGSAPMKERILMLTKRQKNRGICLILALVLTVSAVGCSFISVNGKTEETDNSVNEEELPDESSSETDSDITAETESTEETVPTEETEVPETSDSIVIPEIVLTQVDKMPYPRQIAQHCVSAIGSNAVVWMLDDSPEFCIERYSSDNKETDYFTGTLTLPDGYENPAVFRIAGGGGSGEIDITVKAEQNGETVYLNYFFNFTNEDFLPDSVTPMNELQLKHLLESVSGGAYKGEQLSDYRNDNPGDRLFYEGYTVEYSIPYPYYAGETFDFHLHLPQLGDDFGEAEEWNRRIAETCSAQFGEYLRETAHGNNKDFYANVTWETVTTGDVVTIYILKASGIMNSGAAGLSYDIYHYDTVGQKFLSTDEFLAIYAEGQFADYTVADIVKFMNEHGFTTDEVGSPYPLTEENIQGVIPSVFGGGKFDVVYQGYTMEGRFATRMLFSPYPTYTSDAVYTYRLTYHDYVDCKDKEIYGDPMGYRLLISHRVAGEYDAGYYVDCLFTEDIAERPESYSQAVYGEYYTPIQQDAYGNMHMVIDHETDWGHLNAWIPFDMPDTAQDYYWGVHKKYFSYDRILDGTNYQVNQNIAEQVGQILDAYRNGKDPNELFPASKTEYTPYPLETIRENPTHEEIGEILKNTSVVESGIINFGIDLGGGWSMALPIGIGGFGDGAQAYFTGLFIGRDSARTNTITDIADWDSLNWEQDPPRNETYSFIHDLVSGESEIPEYNGLGINEYSIELLEGSSFQTLIRFTFTVTGNSLPETLLPGTYTWILHKVMVLSVYTEGMPQTQEEGTAYYNRMYGLDRFEGNSAVEAVNTYLSWMPYIYEVSPHGEWDPENVHLPYNYICAHYGNENLEISFDELQSLMSEKFGITVERPTAEPFLLSRCEYNKETDTVRYADTRGYEAVHRILDIREEDGITYVIVQLFADRHRMIPSHKLQFAIGEGEVFLGSEIIQNGNYDPREIS